MPIAKGLPGAGPADPPDRQPNVSITCHCIGWSGSTQRQGLFLHRSTSCDWMAACARLLQPLYDLMVSVVLQSRGGLHTDDTTVKMQELVTHLLSTAHGCGSTWSSDAAHPYNVFDFTVNSQARRAAAVPGQLPGLPTKPMPSAVTTACTCRTRAFRLQGPHYRGGLQRPHCARKFYESRAVATPLRSHQALAYYRQLYELERASKDFSDEQRLQMRQDLAVPISGAAAVLHPWLTKRTAAGGAGPRGPMAEAIGYAAEQLGRGWCVTPRPASWP